MAFTDVLSVINKHFIHKEFKTKRKSVFYHTPDKIGYKMQLDVKHVPKHCKHKNLPLDKKYQYTIIDEASRERFIYFFDKYNQFNTTQFL